MLLEREDHRSPGGHGLETRRPEPIIDCGHEGDGSVVVLTKLERTAVDAIRRVNGTSRAPPGEGRRIPRVVRLSRDRTLSQNDRC